MRIEWVCDLNIERARRFADEHSIERTSTGLDGLPDVDAVLVALPVGVRRPVLSEVFSRGWHAFVEKPFAVSRREHEEILREADDADVQVGVGLMRRFYRPVLDGRYLLRSGLFGPLREVWAGEGFPLRGTGRDDDWYQGDPSASGGGVVAETGSHLIDQVLFLTDAVRFDRPKTAFVVEDGLTLDACIQSSVGRTGQESPFLLHIGLSRLRDLHNAIVLRFDHLWLRVGTSFQGRLELLDEALLPVRVLQPRVGGADDVYQAFALEWQAFLSQCESRQSSDADARTALLTTELIEAATA